MPIHSKLNRRKKSKEKSRIPKFFVLISSKNSLKNIFPEKEITPLNDQAPESGMGKNASLYIEILF
jgi:hypothetical protein